MISIVKQIETHWIEIALKPDRQIRACRGVGPHMKHHFAVAACYHDSLAGEKARSRNASQEGRGSPVSDLDDIANAEIGDQVGGLI